MSKFILVWYYKDNDLCDIFRLDRLSSYVNEVSLDNLSEDDVRQLFKLEKDEYPGDCISVTLDELSYLEKEAQIKINLDRYDYFVEILAD